MSFTIAVLEIIHNLYSNEITFTSDHFCHSCLLDFFLGTSNGASVSFEASEIDFKIFLVILNKRIHFFISGPCSEYFGHIYSVFERVESHFLNEGYISNTLVNLGTLQSQNVQWCVSLQSHNLRIVLKSKASHVPQTNGLETFLEFQT